MNKEKTGRFLGIPYDWRKPSLQRIKSNTWNPNSDRISVPKAYGWGWEVNLHAHLRRVGILRKG